MFKTASVSSHRLYIQSSVHKTQYSIYLNALPMEVYGERVLGRIAKLMFLLKHFLSCYSFVILAQRLMWTSGYVNVTLATSGKVTQLHELFYWL